LTFPAKQRAAIKQWMDKAIPWKGVYFRSVEYRFMDPEDVLSGAGTQAEGGRFAAKGKRAVYLSASDSGASKEVTARKSRLGGVGQISLAKYPRVVYAVTTKLERTLDLSDLEASEAAKEVVAACLEENDLTISMQLARELEAAGIQGLFFQSVVVGGDKNLVVYRSNCAGDELVLQNEKEIIEQAKRIAAKRK